MTSSGDPLVSVILPVFNGAPFLASAIESMLVQTLGALEVIVIDDGSADGSATIAETIAARDPRVTVLRLDRRGFSGALNAGIAAARAPYLARMDAEDIAMPSRLEKQVAFLHAHPDCVAVGSGVEIIDRSGNHLGWRTFPDTHDEIMTALLAGMAGLSHPTVVMRRDALVAAGGYDGARYPSDDLDLWIRLSHRGGLANIAEALLRYRRHQDAVSIRQREEQLAMGAQIVNEERERRHLEPLRGAIFSGRNCSARYHGECARAALMTGSRLTAIRHAIATIAADPIWPPAYVNLAACAVPRGLLRILVRLRGRLRLIASRRTAHTALADQAVLADE